MCDETDRELIRIDFQVIDLEKQQESLEEGSTEYEEVQMKIDGLKCLKEVKKAEQKTS